MAVLDWALENWPTLLQNLGIIGGLGFTAYSLWKDERATRISNSIAIAEQYREIWWEFSRQPHIARVLELKVNLIKQPISHEEELFVNLLILHLETVWRAMKAGMFVKLEGLQRDVQEFLTLPIPLAVFENNKRFRDKKFVRFIETCLAHR